MEYLYLLAGLVLILAGANYLTDGSVALAERFRVPGFLIGLTIVAVGTSTPELVVSFLSALEGEGDMAVGNVVGSNLFNVFIILGVCALIRPLPLTRQNIRRDLPVGVAASLVLYAVLADEVLDPTHPARIGRIEGLAMLLLYVLSVWTAARAARKHKRRQRKRKQYNCSFFHGILLFVKKRPALCGQGTRTRVGWLGREISASILGVLIAYFPIFLWYSLAWRVIHKYLFATYSMRAVTHRMTHIITRRTRGNARTQLKVLEVQLGLNILLFHALHPFH